MTADKINKLITRCHDQSKAAGWWMPTMDQEDSPNLGVKYALMHSELSEAYMGLQKEGLMDDKIPHRCMFEVELADALIRVLDYMGYRGFDYYDPHQLDTSKKLFILHATEAEEFICELHSLVTDSLEMLRVTDSVGENRSLNVFVEYLVRLCEVKNIPLDVILEEKLEFNKTREDHKLVNRLKAGGKKF